MIKFNQYEFEKYVRDQIISGLSQEDSFDESIVSWHFDNVSNWQLVCYLGEYLTSLSNSEMIKQVVTKSVYDPEAWPLHNADPECNHEIVNRFYQGGGYGCKHCSGWYCE